MTKNHPLINLAGFNLESRANKIYLPTQPHQHPTRSLHSGRHTTEAVRNVQREMNKIVERGKAQGYTQTQYRAELRNMLSDLRQDLRGGNTALNSVHRPWAK